MTRPSPEAMRHVAREALRSPCQCGQCPDDAALRALLAMTDEQLHAAMDEMGLP